MIVPAMDAREPIHARTCTRVHTHTHIHPHTHTHTHAHTHTHMHSRMHTKRHTYKHIHARAITQRHVICMMIGLLFRVHAHWQLETSQKTMASFFAVFWAPQR